MYKEKLLATNCFFDNEWLSKYNSLIIKNLNQKKIKFKTQKHHIIPRSIYVDNSDANLVNLLYPEHILAHYYLMKAANNNDTWLDNYLAVKFCLNGYQTDAVTDDWIIENIPDFINDYERAMILGIEKWKNSFGKRYHINNGIKEKRVKSEDLSFWLELGWQLGRIPNKKYGHNQSGKNNGHYGIYKYTNGVDYINCKPEDAPPGYYRTNPELEHFKKIECVETGKIYKSMRSAEKDTGIRRDLISKMCNGLSFRTFKEVDLHFKFAEV